MELFLKTLYAKAIFTIRHLIDEGALKEMR
jgi:hypothetical protein